MAELIFSSRGAISIGHGAIILPANEISTLELKDAPERLVIEIAFTQVRDSDKAQLHWEIKSPVTARLTFENTPETTGAVYDPVSIGTFHERALRGAFRAVNLRSSIELTYTFWLGA